MLTAYDKSLIAAILSEQYEPMATSEAQLQRNRATKVAELVLELFGDAELSREIDEMIRHRNREREEYLLLARQMEKLLRDMEMDDETDN